MESVCGRCGKQESACPERSGGDCTVCPKWRLRVQAEAQGRPQGDKGSRLPVKSG